jgi:hypothetical protein
MKSYSTFEFGQDGWQRVAVRSERSARLLRFVGVMALLAGAVGCGGSGEFTPGADNDPQCPATEMDFAGDTSIPADASCSYANLVTDGNVTLAPGAALVLEGAEVGGNLQGAEGSVIVLRDTIVSGNAQVEAVPSIELVNSTIGGNLQIAKVTGDVSITGTDVLGDVQIKECSGDSIVIEETSVSGNLNCTENSSTIELEDVTVDGEATGQCSEG